MTTELLANRYQVLRPLGEGTMGLVSLVKDTTSGQEVALKVISAKVGKSDKTTLQFKQEFRLMTQLRHPNCCQVHEYGVTEDGEPYFTMEVVPGKGLDEEQLPLDEATFRPIFASLLQALGHVHQLGLVHRDLKSANVRLTPDGKVKLMDFGLMDYAGRAGAPISGTPAYMAPEVIKRGPIDQRSDLYAVGCLAYELLTGKLPFGGSSHTTSDAMAILRAQIHDRPEAIDRLAPGISKELAEVVTRLLAKEPLERFRSTEEVLGALGVPSGPGAGQLLASPLMGRQEEMASLTERLNQMRRGEPGGSVLLWGPPGMGKSRLLEEFRFSAQLEDLVFAQGALHEQGNPPYAPIAQLLKALLPSLKAKAPELLAQHGPVLVKLLPELGFVPATDIDPPSKEKLRLQSTLVEVITTLARKQPTVLVVDDWQWVDPLSAEFLGFLARNTREEPLMIVVSARPTDGGENPVPEGFRRVVVGPLSQDSVRRMVTTMLGTSDVVATFVEKVTAFSEGNPYHVKQLLEHLVQDATLVHGEGGWNTGVELTPDRMPTNLKALLMRKVTHLPPRAQELARLGAVIGRQFDLELLKGASRFGDDELFAAIETLNLNLVFDVGPNGTYSFAQDQLQAMLYDYIPPVENQRLHLVVARALEERLGDTPPSEAPLETITAIAHHYMRARDAEKIIAYALHAGRSAVRLFANADALRFLGAGLGCLREAAPDGFAHERFEYLRLLGDVQRMIGETGEAIPIYEEAIVLAESLGEAAALPGLMTSLAKCFQMQAELDKALSWCERSLEGCEAQGDSIGAARSLLTSCRVQYFRGNTAEAIDQTERGLAKAREAGDPFRIGEALAFLGYVYITASPDKVETGIGYLHESVQILTGLGDKIGLQNCYNLLGNAQNMQGAFLQARETFRLNQKICYEVGMRDDEIISYLNLAVCGLELGEFEEAVGAAQAAYAYALMNQNKFSIALALIVEATAKSYLGEFKGSIALIERALAMALEAGYKYVEMMVMQYKVEIYLVLGHLGEAKTAAKKLIALIQETGDTSPESRMKAFLGEIVGRQGDLEGGREYIQLAISAAMLARAKGIQARAMKVDAWISLQAGEWAEAKDLSERGLAIAREIGAKYIVAELEGVLGEIALATHASDPMPHFEAMETLARQMKSNLLLAQALFGQAAAIGSPMKAVPLVKQAQDLLKGLIEHLDDDSRLCFAQLRERNRILEGDFINGFKPRARDLSIKVSLPGIKLGQNVWGLT